MPPGVLLSPDWAADTVGDKAVKGWWKDDDHVRGVPGTYGKGYDGVRNGIAAGVAVALPRIVRADDEVESVEAVLVVARGLLKAAVRGDMVGACSSLIGDGRRGNWVELVERVTEGASEESGWGWYKDCCWCC